MTLPICRSAGPKLCRGPSNQNLSPSSKILPGRLGEVVDATGLLWT